MPIHTQHADGAVPDCTAPAEEGCKYMRVYAYMYTRIRRYVYA